ncbi:TolC family protein [Shewanella sp. NIFS-20-20]|uniref:TolC family protein n=1 Tax=Shewanella sp. NIFS-20-20 TaxID=2853806 RepID=UPI001C44A59F|nr:TolC family protein [Shewanella sp. NIFS-20-20]MBV7315308.1 TolC family protein [Shewanella sp. NIFS-20-20]
MRLLALALCVLLPLPLAATEISFDAAWQQLQQVSDKLKAQQQQVDRASAEQASGDDLSLPSINIAGSYTYLEQPIELDLRDLNPLAAIDPATLPPALGGALAGIPGHLFVTPFTQQDVFRASLQALWPIYTGGQVTAAQGILAAQVAEEQQAQILASRELFTQLVDRYYGAIVANAVLATQEQLVAALSEHVAHAKSLEQQGQIAVVERLNAEVALDNAKVATASARRQAQMAHIALDRMLKLKVEPVSPLFMLSGDPSLPRLMELTLSQHPALKLLAAKEQQAKGLEEMEKGKYYPNVFLYGNYNLYEDDSLFAKVEPDWMVGVGIKIPLVSRDGRSGKVAAAKSAILQARYTQAQTREDLSLLLDQTYRQMEQAREEYQSLATTEALASENLRLRSLAFTQGLSTSLERVDAQLTLTSVATKRLAARYRYIQAYAHVMSISGQLDEFIARSRVLEKTNAN